MSISEEKIEKVVSRVVSQILSQAKVNVHKKQLGIFEDMNDAIEAAKKAQHVMQRMPLDSREAIISNIRKKTIANAELMARMGVEETGMGNIEHKILKHLLLAEKTPGTEDITTTAWSGDRGLTLIEMGPFGVIGAITPCTNPSETVLCNSIGMIAGGNTVVFNPHPAASKVSQFAVSLVNEASIEAGGPENVAVTVNKPTMETSDIMLKHPHPAASKVSQFAVSLVNEASIEAGGPENVAVTVNKPTMETSDIMLKHKDIHLIAATGGPGVVTTVLSSGKRGIGAGAGNPPVLVDETADIEKAAADIVNGCTFDNNLPCIAEKEIVAVESIVDELTYYLKENGCYVISKEEQDKLIKVVLTPKGLNRKCVGRDAITLLNMIGVNPPPTTRCIIFEGEKEHPLITEELMMPILGIVRAKDFDDAIKKAVWLEHGNKHSAHIHSKNVDHLTRFGQAIDTAIYVKNAPSYAALGFGGEGFCTFTIASRTGEGLTSASTFTKKRRCVIADSFSIR